TEQDQKDIIATLAEATTQALSEAETSKQPSITIDQEKVMPDSSEIDLENESINKKRQRQRSLVLNPGKKFCSCQFHIYI
ncbi:unnamed protein product, partial [Rotaria magnacalcarata]